MPNRRDVLRLAGAGTAGLAVPALLPTGAAQAAPATVPLDNGSVQLCWSRSGALQRIRLRAAGGWRDLPHPSGTYSVLAADTAPTSDAVVHGTAGTVLVPVTTTVARHGAAVRATAAFDRGTLVADWSLHGAEVLVELAFTAATDGWYSIATPTLATFDAGELTRGLVPGYWTGTAPQADPTAASRYGLGIPTMPMVARERSAPTPLSLLTGRDGLTVAMIAEPGTGRDPWPAGASAQTTWQLGLASTDAAGDFAPTGYHPVLGQPGSRLAAGDTVRFGVRFLLTADGWFAALRHAMTEVYPIGGYLAVARNLKSLSWRLDTSQDFLTGPDSQWHTWSYGGRTLGAESAKLSDVGAMWMLGRLSGDPVVQAERLPYARNFKLAQQQADGGPFQGAALGEYFGRYQGHDDWISENFRAGQSANYVSPMFTTFYALADMGNILLFDPDDAEVRDRVRLAADRLLAWQHADGSFDVGYLRDDPTTLMYPELTDYRATWYGLLVAHRVLGEPRYLTAARRGADWFVAHAVRAGRYLGVCDDSRLIPDFHVVFCAQALLDLAEATGSATYRSAAIEVARTYLAHLFTHPQASRDPRTFEGRTVEEWQVSQAGMNYEHAGFYGTANSRGPILLACHTGAFVRFHRLTGDRVFLDLARAAARGRDAFVDPASGIPSYYWFAGSGGAHTYPWHGWWHLGWLVDYLVAEAELRSGGAIAFDRGFMTAKVGASKPTGFAPGRLYGRAAHLVRPHALVTVADPDVDWLTARSADGTTLYLVLLNGSPTATRTTATLDPRALDPGQRAAWGSTTVLSGDASRDGDTITANLAGNGLAVLAIDVSLSADPAGPVHRGFAVTGTTTRPTVTWSYRTTITSWLQWRPVGGNWRQTTPVRGHSFREQLDLSTVDGAVELRTVTRGADGAVAYAPAIRR
ncbi:hypothetical protein Athai_20380 [Actinocatenispora thailandica]|uniref:Glycerophosphoryl diester phosphodiesterase n=1 Tax=Actinocatenispora thailandica TaxID=227318 RepID=A0A7R7DN77_9ACTN|nr:hypothetical protein [Actinocatenispora thailandica]BCJ34535.1 hypothetical protein Athai_20380 [Actinocatenispora thailandica]